MWNINYIYDLLHSGGKFKSCENRTESGLDYILFKIEVLYRVTDRHTFYLHNEKSL